MNWLRLYHDLPHDPKLKRVAHLAGATLPHVITVWVSMLCHASKNEGDKRGTLAGWNDDDWAFDLGMDRAIVFAIREQMLGRMVDQDGSIIAWDRRQFQSDTSRSRQQAYRERKRGRSGGDDNQGGSSEEKQQVNPDVTSPDRHQTVTARHGDATETETEAETEREASPPARPPARARGEVQPSLPEWLPPEAWAEWCAYRLAKGKKAWTQLAAEKSLQTLSKLRDAGSDPVEVIDQSIASGWTGLFEVKGAAATASTKAASRSWIYDNDDPLWRQPQ